jgi:hypothetical protein
MGTLQFQKELELICEKQLQVYMHIFLFFKR